MDYLQWKLMFIGDCSRGRPESSLFNSYYTEVLGRALLLSLDCSTLPLIRILYCWVLSKGVSSTIFKVFDVTRLRIEPRSPGPLVNTLSTRRLSTAWIQLNFKTSIIQKETMSVKLIRIISNIFKVQSIWKQNVISLRNWNFLYGFFTLLSLIYIYFLNSLLNYIWLINFNIFILIKEVDCVHIYFIINLIKNQFYLLSNSYPGN